MQQDLLAERDAAGTWTAATALATPRRERIDADLSALLEDLATIPNLLAARTERMTGLARRSFLRGTAVGAAGAAALGGAAGVAAAAVDAVDAGPGPSGRRLAFEGPHQAGILTAPQEAATFVAFDVLARDAAGLRELFRTLTERIRFLTAGGLPAATDVASPPTDSETLGPRVPSDGLTVTVSVGASLFDDRYGLAARKPARLTPMPVFPDDHVEGSKELHGDLMLQICADSRDTVMHALRDIAKHTRGGMQPSWKVDGFHAAPRPPAPSATSSGSRTASPTRTWRGARRWTSWSGRRAAAPSRPGPRAARTRWSGSSGCWSSSGTGCR